MNNDLIRREALKNDISERLCDKFDKWNKTITVSEFETVVIDAIDNASTVPERDYSQGWHDAITKALNEAYTITTEDGSFKVVQTETLEGLGMSMPMPERPQGEWIARHKENSFGQDVVCFECNKCGEYKLPIIHTMITEPLGVCPNCGVNMQKGGAK